MIQVLLTIQTQSIVVVNGYITVAIQSDNEKN